MYRHAPGGESQPAYALGDAPGLFAALFTWLRTCCSLF
jgi:hypothetical protein